MKMKPLSINGARVILAEIRAQADSLLDQEQLSTSENRFCFSENAFNFLGDGVNMLARSLRSLEARVQTTLPFVRVEKAITNSASLTEAEKEQITNQVAATESVAEMREFLWAKKKEVPSWLWVGLVNRAVQKLDASVLEIMFAVLRLSLGNRDEFTDFFLALVRDALDERRDSQAIASIFRVFVEFLAANGGTSEISSEEIDLAGNLYSLATSTRIFKCDSLLTFLQIAGPRGVQFYDEFLDRTSVTEFFSSEGVSFLCATGGEIARSKLREILVNELDECLYMHGPKWPAVLSTCVECGILDEAEAKQFRIARLRRPNSLDWLEHLTDWDEAGMLDPESLDHLTRSLLEFHEEFHLCDSLPAWRAFARLLHLWKNELVLPITVAEIKERADKELYFFSPVETHLITILGEFVEFPDSVAKTLLRSFKAPRVEMRHLVQTSAALATLGKFPIGLSIRSLDFEHPWDHMEWVTQEVFESGQSRELPHWQATLNGLLRLDRRLYIEPTQLAAIRIALKVFENTDEFIVQRALLMSRHLEEQPPDWPQTADVFVRFAAQALTGRLI